MTGHSTDGNVAITKRRRAVGPQTIISDESRIIDTTDLIAAEKRRVLYSAHGDWYEYSIVLLCVGGGKIELKFGLNLDARDAFFGKIQEKLRIASL